MPVITIGICARNAETYIKQIINCLANQDFPHESMEIIFVDDGSEDRTFQVIKDSIIDLDIISSVYHQEWKGIGPARNVILNHAKGEYILMVDSDQLISYDYVRKHVKFMDKNSKVGICYGILKIPHDESPALIMDLIRVVIQRNEKGKLGVAGGGSTYRVRAMKQVGGYDNQLNRTGEDIDISTRIQEAGWLVSLAGGIIHEKHGENYSWKELWNRYYLHGLNGLYLYKHKKRAIGLFKMTPLAGFVYGMIKMHIAFTLVRRRIVFLLPVFFHIQRSAWCLGFISEQLRAHREIA
jgi:glycosyltransferase involved in cell wall biosynthesis